MPSLRLGKNRGSPSLACLFVLVSVIGTLIAPSTARAHKVNLFAYVEGDTVITESYFSDGRKCRDSTIEVFDKHGKKLAEGKTDEEGRFSFRPPIRTDLVMRLTASMGHHAEYVVPASDLSDKIPAGPAAEAVSAKGPARSPDEASDSLESPPVQHRASTEDIEQAVEKALSRQLAPIRRALEESRRERRFSDVVGGIGYIVGLMGLILYFRSRQRKG